MKYILLPLLLSFMLTASAETIKKWVDDKGVVHYGDQQSSENVTGAKKVEIRDTYDEDAYQEGLRRHEETEQLANEYEQERIAEEKQKMKEDQAEKASKPAAPGGAYRKPPPKPTPETTEPEQKTSE